MKDFLFFLIKNIGSFYLGKKIKKQGILFYLKTVQGLRKGVAAVLLLFVFLQIMILGLAAALICAFFLWPVELETKLWTFFSLGLVFFAVPMTLMIIFLSERFWFKASGAERMISEL